MFTKWIRRPRAIVLGALALAALAAAGGAAAQEEEPARGVAWLGVSLSDVDADVAEAMDVPQGEGALVNDVVDDSPAQEAGLEDGDVVVRFDGRRIGDAGDLTRAVRDAKPGDSVVIVVVRDGREQELEATLGEAKESERIAGRADDPPSLRLKGLENLEGLGESDVWVFGQDEGGPHPRAWAFRAEPRAWLGARLGELTAQLGSYFGLDSGGGALVQEVVEDSPAQKAGLRAGDVIVRLDDEDVDEPADVIDALEDAEPGDAMDLVVVRERAERSLRVELGEPPASKDRARIIKRFQGRELPKGSLRNLPREEDRDLLIRRQAPESRAQMQELRRELEELRAEMQQLREELRRSR